MGWTVPDRSALSRTIADISSSPDIRPEHIPPKRRRASSEAITPAGRMDRKIGQ
ncbi:MAG: hypothetical protein ACHQQQ_11885 [Bacteroidota bacterium]